MITWIGANLGTVLITLLIILMVAGIIYTLVKDKKQGRSICGGNCTQCKMCSNCSDGSKHKPPGNDIDLLR